MSMIAAVLQEFDNEAGTTRRVLERVPADKLAWKPHPKSMSLGDLALHIAGSPAVICGWAAEDETTFSGQTPPTPKSTAEILAAHDAGVKTVKEKLTSIGDEGLNDDAQVGARARHRDEPLDSPPRPAVGLPASARRAGAVDLRPERRREPFCCAHVATSWNAELSPSLA